jgi:triacylglycerol lipase
VVDAMAAPVECIILLHGLGRTSRSMSKLQRSLHAEGYLVANIGYPSRKHSVEVLAPEAVERGLASCRQAGATNIHFVTHSLGGILVRYYLSRSLIPELGSVVMLGPPNQGSEIADALARVPGFAAIAGPSALQLGTGPSSIPNTLGAVSGNVGVVAGTRSINPAFSLLLPGPDDGMVSVRRTRLEGMSDFAVVRASHTFVMRSREVMDLILAFIRTGRFSSYPGKS